MEPYGILNRGKREPDAEMMLIGDWAYIVLEKIEALSKLALDEKWYYGSQAPSAPSGNKIFPLLTQYLNYTFKRLCDENKIMIEKYGNKEYAAFNTGLVDRTYKYIYALFTTNNPKTIPERKIPYWNLMDFVVEGEDNGKTLVSYFNPLPKKADYFENDIKNMFYDTSSGNLSCDYKHILIENISRFPIDFLKDNCPEDLLRVDGVDIDTAYQMSYKDEARINYFKALGEKINNDARILNRLINRVDDAVDLALKRVEWNYKTAIPMYYPAKKCCSLLLPLALVDENHIDLALVVERQPSNAYQGQTVLPLNLAYSNSRLITRPDSDWLRTDSITENEDVK